MTLEFEEETGKIIAAAIEVHKDLGPGFLESVYENALAIELRAREIPFQQQMTVPVRYKGAVVGLHRIDLFVFDQFVVELKAIKALEDVHFVVVRSYLRALGQEHGLLLNFSKPTLEAKRVIAKGWPARSDFPSFLGSSLASAPEHPAPK
ncbi:MAG: GxxExxY protein [Planctomycetes bacterium]|nr:GxxExxY protein [Planctomycetota bacterium]